MSKNKKAPANKIIEQCVNNNGQINKQEKEDINPNQQKYLKMEQFLSNVRLKKQTAFADMKADQKLGKGIYRIANSDIMRLELEDRPPGDPNIEPEDNPNQ